MDDSGEKPNFTGTPSTALIQELIAYAEQQEAKRARLSDLPPEQAKAIQQQIYEAVQKLRQIPIKYKDLKEEIQRQLVRAETTDDPYLGKIAEESYQQNQVLLMKP